MQQFIYKAVTQDGKRIQGSVEAKDKENAVNILREKKLIITELFDQNKSLKHKILVSFFKVSFNDIVGFTRQLSTMVSSGLPIIKSLQMLRKKANPSMAQVIDDISSSVEGGDSLYKAMSKHPKVFSEIYLALVQAGELGGVLDQVLDRLAITIEQQKDFRSKVKSSMLYPIIVFMAMIAVSIVMVFFVMPQISSLYEDFQKDLPVMTEIVLGVSKFIREKWYFFLIIIFGIGGGFILWMKSKEGKKKMDRFILEIPYVGELQHKIISADVIRTLALLVKSGVSIVEALNVVSKVSSNSVYQEGIENASENVEKGITLAASFAQENIFPEIVIQMMSVGEETGKLDDMLDRIAKQFTKESLLALKSLVSAIEPAMIIVMGIGVGILVISIIVPIYNLTSSF